MSASDERRIIVTYEAANGGAPTSAVARDVALGGLFIETTEPLAVGALLSVELKSPTAAVTLEARVFSTRTRPEGPDAPAGMAVRFLDLPAGVVEKLQAILDHHRPPARTRLGIGDENEMLWASAGGRDDPDTTDQEVLAIAATVAVEGRPTVEIVGPSPGAAPPPAPRHPTPRMIPLAPPPSAAPPPPHAVAQPPAPVQAGAPTPASRGWIGIVVGVLLAVSAALAWLWLTRLR